MQIIRYQKGAESAYGYLDGDSVGGLTGDLFGQFVRGPRIAALAEVRLLAPCLPSKVVGVARNFADRVREEGAEAPALPLLYVKPSTAVIGPGDVIRLPPQSQHVEYAAELGVVIGRRARWVAPEDAAQYVLGYTCANDVTARDLLEQDGLWARGKGFDTFCPLGPSMVTNFDPTAVRITCKVNGETRQMSSTHDMLFTVPQLIAFASSVMTLLPGDVLLTGSPAGVGPLAAGDTVEIEIEGLGTLTNTAQAETREA
jgi:2-keto-4-pentenoate hydratase/2-oxohepta-3-ene-1,7-dioic acid hydratase in catechol pathway